MSNLQWALLLLVVVVVIGVYFYMRKSTPLEPLDEEPPLSQDEPREQSWRDADLDWLSRDDIDLDHAVDPFKPQTSGPPADASDDAPPSLAPEPGSDEAAGRSRVRMPNVPEQDQKLLVLHVAAPPGERFEGAAVHLALESAGLHFGPKQIYHRIREVGGVPESVFSVANMLKPGFLDPMERDTLLTPGLSLFMVLPGPEEPVPAFRDFQQTAEALSRELGGEVLDERRQPLTRQMSQFMAEEVADLERRQLAERGADR